MSTPFSAEHHWPLSHLKKNHPRLAAASIRSIGRWTQRRTRGALLESIYVGGRLMTSFEAVDRFLAALNPVSADGPRSPNQRRRESELAAQELTQAGA